MLEAVKEIGELSLKECEEDFAFSLVKEDVDSSSEENGKKHVLTLDFRIKEGKINLDFEEIDSRKCEKYLWVGNADRNNPQDRLTTDKFSYFLNKTIPNLYSNLPEGDLKSKLEFILNEFFLKQKKDYLLDLGKITGSNFSVEELLENIPEQSKKSKEFYKEYEKSFYKILKVTKNIQSEDIAVYSIKIDGKYPSELPEYIKYIEKKLIDERFKDSTNTRVGICYICGEKTTVTSDTTKLLDKYYITKLITFASGLNKGGFLKNFAICKDCYKKLVAGSRYIKNHFSQKLAGVNLYLIPSLIFASSKNYTLSDIEVTNISFRSIKSFEGKLEFERRVENNLVEYKKYQDKESYANINLLFYKGDQKGEFKIKKLIKDVPLRRVKEIRNAQNYTKTAATQLLGDSAQTWFMSLDQIYHLLPIRIDKKTKKSVDYKKTLYLYEDIFLRRKVNRQLLMSEFLELFSVYRFEKFEQFSIKKPSDNDIGMVYAILKTNFLLKMFYLLNILDGGGKMIEKLDELSVSEEIKNYWKEMDFSEQQAALFMLGYLIGEVGNAQRTLESSKKPILDKINFQGMDLRRVLMLSNEIFEKLDQYNIRKFNEVNFAVMRRFMDKHSNWQISDSENVYWILSGYAFNTYKIITSKKREEKNEQ